MLHQNRQRMIAIGLGLASLIIYLAFISPAMRAISTNADRWQHHSIEAPRVITDLEPSSKVEEERLEEIKQAHLLRFKKIDTPKSLFLFSSILAESLASEARLLGLKVMAVKLEDELIRGKYVPSNDLALEILNQIPSPQWAELPNPMDLPMLKLPTLEIYITVSGEYSKVFSFIESLPDFPVTVSLAGLEMTEDLVGNAFQLKIRGYYYDSRNGRKPTDTVRAIQTNVVG